MPEARAAPEGRRAGLRPLVLGVTGHRDLRPEDVAPLGRAVAALIDDLRERYRATPLDLHSALAEGADRLVARVGLAAGAELVVPLPFPRSRYERDFDDPASLREFRRLLGRATRSFVVPGDGREDTVPEADGYRRLGRYLARRCDLLLALWDGASAGAANGGTADVVRTRLETGRGPVWHLLTPRRSNPDPDGVPFAVRTLFPAAGPDADRFHAELARRDVRNRASSAR